MKLYRITAEDLSRDIAGTHTCYVGTQADAAAKRKELIADDYTRKQITTEEVDVPTDKAGLLAWLNEGT